MAEKSVEVDRSAAASREQFLDAAERLMSERGYAGTSVSAICKQVGVAATSLYWHFGSKEGLLAAVMERGAARWFAGLPRWDDLVGDVEQRTEEVRRRGAAAVTSHPVFLRLFYLLALEGSADQVAGELVVQVRERARGYFAEAIAAMLADAVEPEVARAAADELARFAVAFSDGCFFATQLEPGEADLSTMYGDLVTALHALAPAAIARAQHTKDRTGQGRS
ncbi:TetR/AcrR family transcriptional regulator [Nocardia pneumoniae]|uniref:TetR/AcrR family transcriptional regulator n=1 Tax=Nocardia pneumoniae TaxID=228601 RepID=UPI00031F407C|nr:TetR/AcrR family transcriptional regulator [Nocardia pneumoniae]